MSITVQDFVRTMEGSGSSRTLWDNPMVWSAWEHEPIGKHVILAEVEVELVEKNLGDRDDYSADIYMIFRVGDVFMKKSGYWSSYDGTDWDGAVSLVTPERIVTTKWS